MNDTITKGIKIFEDNISTLTKASYDSDKGVSLVDSDVKTIYFDSVKDEFCRNKDIRDLKSIDALHIFPQAFGEFGAEIMFEFKNGRVGDNKGEKIRLKLRDSIKMYLEITGESEEMLGEEMSFILVYNAAKNPNIGETQMHPKEQMLTLVSSKAKEQPNFFGLEKYIGKPFRGVYAFTTKQFSEKFNVVMKNA